MTLSILAHQLTVNSVPVTVDIPARINIKKRREQVIYRTLSNRDNINIAYLIGQQVTPNNSLVISDRSTSLVQNRILNTQTPTIVTAGSITLNVDKFLITDVFTEDTPTQLSVPLFFVHTLSNFNNSLNDFTHRTLLSIEFADYSLKPIQYSEYVLDTTTGKIYNNIENTYNDNTGDFDITFVKYTVKIQNGSSQTVEVYHELVSNESVYQQADFDDVDLYGNIKAGLKKYLIEQLGDQQFLVTLPDVDTYAYKETPSSRLRILPPAATDIYTPWNVRITNGQFITSLQKTANSFVNHKYQIAEFNAQAFFPFPPYKIQLEQRATWISNNLIHLPKNIASNTGLGLFVDITIRDRKRALKYVYSDDPNKIGTIFQGSIRYTNGILSIDQPGGFIELVDKVRDDDIITATYYTEENEYEFTPVDFNPTNNVDILNQRVVVYVNPETFQTGNLDRSLYYLLVNTLGEITFSSQVAENAGALDPATEKLFSEDFYADGTPRHTFYYDQESTASGLDVRASGINLGYVDEFSFIDKYTVESVLLTSTVTPSGTALENFVENPRFLVLGDIYVGESQSLSDLTIVDVREQGGGIKDEYRAEALQEQAEVAWYWDFNSRRPIPAMTAFMIEIPQTILTDHGGVFTRDQVMDIVQRHMDAGGYPVIKTYGIDPVVTDLAVASGLFTIGWPSYGSSTTYNVYYSKSIDDNFIVANSNPIVDNSSGNEFTVSGLIGSTKYYVKVGAFDSDGDESFGPTISAIPTLS